MFWVDKYRPKTQDNVLVHSDTTLKGFPGCQPNLDVVVSS